MFIGLDLNGGGVEGSLNFGRDFAGGNKQRCRAIRANQQVRQEHGVVGDVAAAQVGEPCDVVQRGDEVPIGAALAHGLAHAVQFFGGGLRHKLGLLREHGRGGQGRAGVAPRFGGVIQIVFERDIFRRKGSLNAAQLGNGEHIGRDAHGGVFRQRFGKMGDVVAPVFLFLQTDAAGCQLSFGLRPIARVCPQFGVFRLHHQHACRAGEARKILARLPMLGDVFGEMRVGGGNDERIKRVAGEGLAQGGEHGGVLWGSISKKNGFQTA